jgi:hypothetical protein
VRDFATGNFVAKVTVLPCATPFALHLSSGIRRDDPQGLDADHGCKFVAFSAPQLMIYSRPIDPA